MPGSRTYFIRLWLITVNVYHFYLGASIWCHQIAELRDISRRCGACLLLYSSKVGVGERLLVDTNFTCRRKLDGAWGIAKGGANWDIVLRCGTVEA